MWINVTIKIIGYYECDLKQSEWSKRHAYLHRRYWKTCSFNAAAVAAATDAFIVSYSLYYYYYDSVPLTHSLHTLTRSIGMLAAPCTRSHSLPSPFWFLFYFISILIDCKRNLLFVRCWFFNEYVRWLYTLEMFPSSIFNSLCFIGSSSVFWVGEWFCVAGFCYSLCLHQHNRTHNHTHTLKHYIQLHCSLHGCILFLATLYVCVRVEKQTSTICCCCYFVALSLSRYIFRFVWIVSYGNQKIHFSRLLQAHNLR